MLVGLTVDVYNRQIVVQLEASEYNVVVDVRQFFVNGCFHVMVGELHQAETGDNDDSGRDTARRQRWQNKALDMELMKLN